MACIDSWSKSGIPENQADRWFSDRVALRLSGFLGLGTELFVLMLFSLAGRLDLYLLFNIVGLNTLWACTIAYRKFVLSRALRRAV